MLEFEAVVRYPGCSQLFPNTVEVRLVRVAKAGRAALVVGLVMDAVPNRRVVTAGRDGPPDPKQLTMVPSLLHEGQDSATLHAGRQVGRARGARVALAWLGHALILRTTAHVAGSQTALETDGNRWTCTLEICKKTR